MKTNTKNQKKAGLQNRPEQSSNQGERQINLKRRFENQALNMENLLALLRGEAPGFFKVAEVVGKWVWIQFDGKQPVVVTRALSELGFHWNNTRQAWQHPCGTLADERATYDPRKRYGSYFAASKAA